jgi:hypothetical protein
MVKLLLELTSELGDRRANPDLIGSAFAFVSSN